MHPVTGPIERVQRERKRRGWSIRTAASAGGISNQTWSTFEQTGVVTDGMQAAIVKAFGWPADWQELEDEEPVLNRLVGEMAGLRREVRDLAKLVKALHAEQGAVTQPPGDAAQGRRSLAR